MDRVLDRTSLNAGLVGIKENDTFPPSSVDFLSSKMRWVFERKNCEYPLTIISSGEICECSSAGRALPCQGKGREFEPHHSLHKELPL